MIKRIPPTEPIPKHYLTPVRWDTGVLERDKSLNVENLWLGNFYLRDQRNWAIFFLYDGNTTGLKGITMEPDHDKTYFTWEQWKKFEEAIQTIIEVYKTENIDIAIDISLL